MARVIKGGVLEFLGRSDFQVEIGSKRVEVNEVEAAIQSHLSIREVLVTGFQKENKDTALVAYVSFHKNKNISEKVLTTFLEKQLPPYMIPSVFIIMDSFPLNANGKVDRKKLPIPSIS